jgi:sodium-dependent dicarboxylate transporter 2/3/5
MWISNTATTMMMVPIAMAIIYKLRQAVPGPAGTPLAVGLLIGIAYSASIGGVATLIGTPPNLAFSKIYTTTFPQAPDISFAQWILFGFPVALIFLIIAWQVLMFVFVRRGAKVSVDMETFRQEYHELGRMSYEERMVLILFVLLAFLWLFRQPIELGGFSVPGWSLLLPEPGMIDDGTVAIIIATILFLIPSRSQPGKRLMDWRTANRLHWGIVILFGGGFALAAGFTESGLSAWLAQRLMGLAGVSSVVMVGSVCTMLTFLTELTSNTATTQIVLPLLGALAVAIRVHPLLLMIPATLSASCAFMLPVATPPNAIIFGTGEIRMADMIRVGIIMNLIGVVIITTMMFLLGMFVFAIDPSHVPDWATG